MDIARRFEENPLLSPGDVAPSHDLLRVECLLNPGAFRFGGRTGLLMRVAERQEQREGFICTTVCDESEATGIGFLDFSRDDPDLDCSDPRVFSHRGACYLTTLSHLRLAWSEDGRAFTVEPKPALIGRGPLERFGIEDSRVSLLDGIYHLTFTAVSEYGVAVAMATTEDWREFRRHGLIFPPTNKDCALFEERVHGQMVALHRPEGRGLGGAFMWVAKSPDGIHWGEHACVARTRPGRWDETRVGAGAAPIKTDEGWLAIYHGADASHRYCLGALLLDLDDPAVVRARSEEPIMEPVMDYELKGFFGNVVFTNGQVIDGDTVTIYYGASDSVICGATLSVREILDTLR